MATFTMTPTVGRIAGRQSFLTLSQSSRTRALLALESSSAALSLVPLAACSTAPSLLGTSSINCTRTYSARRFTAATTVEPAIKLYQYHICPFCNIAKSLLSYSKVDYESVEVNPLTKAELKPWSGDYKKVPIALIDEAQVNGSEEIIESILDSPHVQNILEARWAEECTNGEDDRMTMQQFQRSENVHKWLRFARDDLAAILYPNICGSLSDSYDAFGYVKDVDSFSTLQKTSIQWMGALAMYFAASKIKSKRNITDERASLHEALDKFESEGLLHGNRSYLSGGQCPDMSDVAVFGVLHSVKGLNAHDDAIQSRGGHVKEWYGRMHQQVLGEEAKL